MDMDFKIGLWLCGRGRWEMWWDKGLILAIEIFVLLYINNCQQVVYSLSLMKSRQQYTGQGVPYVCV
jgi:hypothetical protein